LNIIPIKNVNEIEDALQIEHGEISNRQAQHEAAVSFGQSAASFLSAQKLMGKVLRKENVCRTSL